MGRQGMQTIVGFSRGQAQAAIDASIGGNQMPFVETCPYYAVASSTAPGANFLVCFRVRVAKPTPLSAITAYVATQNGNVDVGVYQSDGTTLTKIASSGSTAVGAAGAPQTIALTAGVSLQPGIDYYLAAIVDGTASLGRAAALVAAAVGLVDKQAVTKAQTFPLPATATLASLSSGLSSVFWLHAA